MIVDDLREYKRADERFLEARSSYVKAFGIENLPKLDSLFGRMLLSAAEEGYGDSVKLLLKKHNLDEKHTRHSQTPLSWAAEDGHEAVVKLLRQHMS